MTEKKQEQAAKKLPPVKKGCLSPIMHWISALAQAEAENTPSLTAYYGWPVSASVSLTGPEGNRTYVAYAANNPDNNGSAEGLADHEQVSAYFHQFKVNPEDGWRSFWLGKTEILQLLIQMSDEASHEKACEARSTLEQAAPGQRLEILSEIVEDWQGGERLLTAELVEWVYRIINGNIEDELDDEEEDEVHAPQQTWRTERDFARTVRLVLCADLALAILALLFMETGALVSGTFPGAHLLLPTMLTLPGLLAYFGYKSSDRKWTCVSIGTMELWTLMELAIGYQYGLLLLPHYPIITHTLERFAVYFPYAVGFVPVAFLALIAYFAGKLWPTKRPMVGMIALVQTDQHKDSSRQHSPDRSADANPERAEKEN